MLLKKLLIVRYIKNCSPFYTLVIFAPYLFSCFFLFEEKCIFLLNVANGSQTVILFLVWVLHRCGKV